MAVDVILCTANKDNAGLRRTLLSLRESTLRNIHIFLVNDSPEPLSGNIPIEGLNITLINLMANLGLTRALKAVEHLLTAQFVARIDCGDTMSPHRLKKQHDFLLQNSACVLVGTRSQFFIRTESQIHNIGLSPPADNIQDLNKYLLWANPLVHGSIMFRRDAFITAGGYDANYTLAQDFNLYMRMRAQGDIKILPDILYTHYFNMTGSNTVQKNKSGLISGLRSRLTLSKTTERFKLTFIAGIMRDLILLATPTKFLIWARFGRHIRMNNREAN